MRREFLMLGQICTEPTLGWWASEKIDGMRAFWDGGVTRDVLLHEVPWSAPKARGRYATGLWSRLGNVIFAPDEWLDKLPPVPLDGELFYDNFQKTMSICRKIAPLDPIDQFCWGDVKYYVFDVPPPSQVFRSGVVGALTGKNKSEWVIDIEKCRRFMKHHPPALFQDRYAFLREQKFWNDTVVLLDQKEIDNHTQLEGMLEEIYSRNGEGVILRNPQGLWVPKRTNDVQKIKSYFDEEGTVKGYIWGRGKYHGMLGALIVRTRDGKTLELSGMNDNERALYGVTHAEDGKVITDQNVYSTEFKIGDVITFRYRSLTNDGIPKEARYMRKA